MWSNNFKTAEHKLAIKLTSIIVSLLAMIVLFGFFLGSKVETGQEVSFFRERMEKMQKTGRLNDLIGPARPTMGVRPGFPGGRGNPRNVIIVDTDGTKSVFGFLSELEFDLPQNLPIEKQVNLEIDGNKILLYGFNLKDKHIYFYENIDLITKLRANVLFGSLGAILLFGCILYFIALWIARKTIEPIRKSEEYARSYNHHIAHELKTPLSIIKSDLDLALRIPEEASERIHSAIDEAKNMRRTVDDLLFLAELEAKVNFSSITFSDEMRLIQEELVKTYSDKKLSFVFSGDFSTKIQTDVRLFRVLLRNIYENACKYSSIESEILTEISPKTLIVKNSIGASDLPDIHSLFDPFVGTAGSGNGLGLSIVKRICDVLAWKVRVDITDDEFVLILDLR